MQKWTFLQKWRAQNWSSIKIFHYRPLQHADRPKLSELWQNCDWHDFRGIFCCNRLFFNFFMGKPGFCPLLNVARVMPIKNGPLGAFHVVWGCLGTLWMSKMLTTSFFPIFWHFRLFPQNWMQKWAFLQKLNLQNWLSIKKLHSELWLAPNGQKMTKL